MWPNSLAFRLLLTTLIWSLVILVIAGVSLLALYRQSAEQNFDRVIEVSLLNLVASVEINPAGEVMPVVDLGDPRFSSFRSGWYWQIAIAGSAEPLLLSTSLAGEALTVPDNDAQPFGPDFRRVLTLTDGAGNRVRAVEQLVSLGAEDGIVSFLVTGSLDDVERDVATFRDRLVLFLALFGVGLVVSTVVVVIVGLRPLDRIRRALGRIRAGDASELEGRFPSEIAPLVDEMNALIDANRKVVDRARTQVGNLAHGLKTPLAVLTNEADSATGPLADKVSEQVGAMRQQLDFYLDRARIAAGGNIIGVATDMDPVIDRLERILPRMHRDRSVVMTVERTKGLRFQGEAQDLEELLGNLLDNAFKWARSQVRLSVAHDTGGARSMVKLAIEDDGPGLTEAQCTEAMRRGRRLDESKPGSGLGLSIVADLADLYGGRFVLDRSALGGLRARLDLPAVQRG